MNCKQGDLAVIVAPRGDSLLMQISGHLVTCEHLTPGPKGAFMHWKISPEYACINRGVKGRVYSIADECLRPVPKLPDGEQLETERPFELAN